MADDASTLTLPENFKAKFWDEYVDGGMEAAMAYFMEYINPSDEIPVEEVVKPLVAEAIGREIDLKEFLVTWEEYINATGTDNDAGGIHPDSGDETDEPQDEDESAPAGDATPVSGDTEQGDETST